MSRYFYTLILIILLVPVVWIGYGPNSTSIPIQARFMDDSDNADVILTPSYTDRYSFALLSQGSYAAFVSPDSYNVLPGGTVGFKGSGFASNEDIAVIRNGRILDLMRSDMDGNFNSPRYASGYLAGVDKYVFRGGDSGIEFGVGIKIESIKPWIGLDGYYKPAGDSIAVSGHFFGANEAVLLSFNGSDVLRTSTDAKGVFYVRSQVPNGQGKVLIKAYSMRTGRVALATLTRK